MKKWYMFSGVGLIIVLLISMLSYIFSKKQKEQVVLQKIFSVSFHDLNSNPFTFKGINSRALTIIYEPECGSCEEITKTIRDNLPYFKQTPVYFITKDSLSHIKRFINKFQLDTTRITFLQDKDFATVMEMKIKDYPTILVIGKNQKVLRKIKGAVPFSEIKPWVENE